MKILMTTQLPHPVRANISLGLNPAKWAEPHPRFLRWSRNLFLVVGVLLLGYCGFVLLDAKLFQADQARLLQQELSGGRRASARTPSFVQGGPCKNNHQRNGQQSMRVGHGCRRNRNAYD